MFSKMRQKISLIRQKSLFTRHMGQTDLLKITQTRHCAGEDRRQSKEKPMLSSTGWNTPEKRGIIQDAKHPFPNFSGGGQTTSERREDAPAGTGRRSSELREESSSRKPEIALPRQGSSGALPYRGRRDSGGGVRQRRGIPAVAVQISPNPYSRTGRTGNPPKYESLFTTPM